MTEKLIVNQLQAISLCISMLFFPMLLWSKQNELKSGKRNIINKQTPTPFPPHSHPTPTPLPPHSRPRSPKTGQEDGGWRMLRTLGTASDWQIILGAVDHQIEDRRVKKGLNLLNIIKVRRLFAHFLSGTEIITLLLFVYFTVLRWFLRNKSCQTIFFNLSLNIPYQELFQEMQL